MRNYTKLSVIAAAVLMMSTIPVMADEDILTNDQMEQQMQADMEVAKVQEALDWEAMEETIKVNDALTLLEGDRMFPPAVGGRVALPEGDIQPDGSESNRKVWYGSSAGTDGDGFVHIGGYAGNGSESAASYNTMVGFNAGGTGGTNSGDYNSLFGFASGWKLSSGQDNTFLGSYVGTETTTGIRNTFNGSKSGYKNTASYNTFNGYGSGYENTAGDENTYLGYQSGYLNKTGGDNVMIGSNTGYNNTATGNTFVGTASGNKNTSGHGNVFFGDRSGYTNTTGTFQTLIGDHAGYNSINSYYSTNIGSYSGYSTTTGSSNAYIGSGAGYSNQTGNYNVFIGNYAGWYELGSNKLYIDSSNTAKPLIYGEFDNDMVRINGTFETTLSEESDANNKNLIAVSRNNTGSGGSDVGFSLENVADDYKWTFRTYSPVEGFAASKIGTGGTEFEVGNTGTDLSTTVVKMGGVVVFKDGHLVNTGGNELTSLVQEQSIKLAAQDKLLTETRAEAKAMKIEAKAKDTEIIAMKAKQEAQNIEIAQLKTMQKKVAMMESILINLALDTSSSKQDKVSFKQK